MRIGFVVAVLAVMLTVATGWVIFDAAYQEPYATITVRDAYSQLALSSVLAVLWVELAVCCIWLSAKHWLLKRATVCVIAGAVFSVLILFTCQRSYIADVAKSEAKRCHPAIQPTRSGWYTGTP